MTKLQQMALNEVCALVAVAKSKATAAAGEPNVDTARQMTQEVADILVQADEWASAVKAEQGNG